MCGVSALMPFAYRSYTSLPRCSTTSASVSVAASCLVDAERDRRRTPSGSTFAGSLAMSAEGTSSRTCWKAHRLKGGVRQFASVTCEPAAGGKPCISFVIRIESYLE